MAQKRTPKGTRVPNSMRPVPARNKRKPERKKAEKRPSALGSRLAGADWSRIRLWLVGFMFAAMWIGLWGRAFYLQIIEGPDLAAEARRKYQGTELVEGARGSILDRNGNILARTVEAPSLWVNPRAVTDKQATASFLSRTLNIPVNDLLRLLNEDKQFVWVRRKIDFATAESIREARMPGVHFNSEYERVYPYKHLAGQLLGFVDIDDKGREGMEATFENVLGGQRVRQAVGRDASGRRMVIRGTEGSNDLRGGDVRLTIDTQVQFFAEEALAESVDKFGAKWGGCIVVDIPTGEVLAWAQYPFFDPNNAGRYEPGQRRNRLSSDALEQGSTIKSFALAAALEEEVVDTDTVIDCENGRWKFGKFYIHDEHPYSSLPVSKILHVSSNIGIGKIGLNLGAERYYRYLKKLGFGEKTGLPLFAETRGIFRDVSKWSELDLASSAFGQSFSATLAQMAKAYLCLVGGGTQRDLHLVMDETCALPQAEDPAGERIFSESTTAIMLDLLRGVVEEQGGTGRHARIPGMEVGGKTGTAQKADKTGKYGKGRVGSFVGVIPIEEPRYLICVVLDEPSKNPYGGVIAAPVFRHVALRTMAYHGRLPETDDPVVRAITDLRTSAAQNLRPGTQGGTQAAAVASASGEMAIKTIVPPLEGLGVRSAVAILAEHGVMPSIKGTGGFVVRQVPASGTVWPDNRECTIWLQERTL